MSEGKRYPCGRRELFTIEMYFAFDAILREDENQKSLKNRCQLAGKRTWGMYRAGVALLEKAFSQLLDTCEVPTLKHMKDIGLHFQPVLKRREIGQKAFVYADAKDIATIVNKAMENECALCMKEGDEEHRCPLRWSIAHIIPPDQMVKNGECPYKDCARRGKFGDYIAKD